jgi:hypothetical protein
MANDPRQSVAFHAVASALLWISVAVAAYVFFVFLWPGTSAELDWGYIDLSISTFYSPLLITFVICCSVVLAILVWRAWLLYLGPWWRRQP